MKNGKNTINFYATKAMISKVISLIMKRKREAFKLLCLFVEESIMTFNKINNNEEQFEINPCNEMKESGLKIDMKDSAELLTSAEYEEKLRELKKGIFQVKMISLIGIINKEIKLKFICFIEKLYLKRHMEHLFKTGDNFLYFFPQQKLFKFTNNYAYRRLIFVFKAFRYRRNFLMRNIFKLWKLQMNLTSFVLIPDNIIQHKERCTALVSLVNDIIKRHQLTHAIQKLSFFYWTNLTKWEKYQLVQINKGALILKHLFQKYKLALFYLLPYRNYAFNQLLYQRLLKCLNSNDLYTELTQNDTINKKTIDNIIHKTLESFKEEKKRNYEFKMKNKLMKILMKQDLKCTFDKGLYIAFKKFKQLTTKSIEEDMRLTDLRHKVIDLETAALINGSLILLELFKQRYLCDILYLKQKFIDNTKAVVTMKSTLYEYGKQYKNVITMLLDEHKVDMLIIRNKYQKVFAMKKILMILFKHQFQLNDHNTIIKRHYLEGCFYRWKASQCEIVRQRNVKIFVLSSFIFKLEQKLNLNIRNQFLTNFIIKAYTKTERQNFQLQSCTLLVNKVKKALFKDRISIYLQIFYSKYYQLKQKHGVAVRLFDIYHKRYQLKQQAIIFKVKDLQGHYKKWFNISRKIFNIKEITMINKTTLLKYAKLYDVFQLLTIKCKRDNLKKWKGKLKKHYSTSNDISIDSKIIQNMSRILLEYEREDTKVKHDIVRCKLGMSKGKSLYKCIFSKHINILLHYFILWKITNIPIDAYDDLVKEARQVQIETDELIDVYEEKKNEYQRVVFEYEYMKKHYCKRCMGKSIEIDYKSLDNEVFNEMEYINNNNTSFNLNLIAKDKKDDKSNQVTNPNETFTQALQENLKEKDLDQSVTLGNKEDLLKNYHDAYANQAAYYEEYIRKLTEKKEELLAMKKELLDKRVVDSNN